MPSGLVRPSSEIEPIVGIQFGIFSPDEIEKRSVVEITNSGTYDGAEPRINGLFDQPVKLCFQRKIYDLC